MGRRSTPERIDQAKREAIVRRLEGEGWPRETAETPAPSESRPRPPAVDDKAGS
jgi:hypothetical protein